MKVHALPFCPFPKFREFEANHFFFGAHSAFLAFVAHTAGWRITLKSDVDDIFFGVSRSSFSSLLSW